MSQLFLIRHAQASFLEADYDRLSARGEEQARALGEWIVASSLEPHAIFIGPRVRHRRTAELAAEVAASAGRPFPQATMLDDLDEFRAEELILHAMGHLDEHPSLRAIVEAQDSADRAKLADRVLREVLERWSTGVLSPPDVESFSAFRERVGRALRAMTETDGRSRTVLAFTSGGTIGAAVAEVLHADNRAAVELGLVLHNSAFSEILFTRHRRSLSSHNRKPHLAPAALTYR